MTTRREALWVAAGGLVGAAALAAVGCEERFTRAGAGRARAARAGDLLIVELTDGLALVDSAGGRPTITGAPAVASPDWTHMVSGAPAVNGFGTRLSLYDVETGQMVFGGTLKDRLEPRVVAPNGWRVALAPPTGRRPDPYRPVGRERTTLVVADTGGERIRAELPGNVEPEAFSPDGNTLFVLEYLPPRAPDRYRVRRLDLATPRLEPLLTRVKTVVPTGAEEEMRGEGRQAVYDPTRTMLFTLYTHQPDHLHTRELASGARDAHPDVHAFVHSLHLTEQWAYCIDLPPAFGRNPAAGHSIALSPDRSRLYVADAVGGSVAVIDTQTLTVLSQLRFGAAAGWGEEAAAAVTPDGTHLLVGGHGIAAVPLVAGAAGAARAAVPAFSPTPAPVRGLAVVGDRVYLGQRDGVVWLEWATGRQLGRVAVPGLRRLRHATAATDPQR
jgi:YVTN family beta-propeller protein